MRQPLVSCLLFPGLCLAAGFPARAQSLLVVNQGDTSLSIVDPASAKQVAVIAEDTPTMHGHEVATSPDGHTAYVPIYGNVGVGKPGLDGHEMLIIDLPSRKTVGPAPTGQPQSHMLVLSHDGRRGYTANVGPGTVSVLDMVGKKTLAV